MEHFDSYYPPKPALVKKESQGHIAVTISSMVLFAVTFSLIINDYLFIGLLIAVLLIHELGHFLTMKAFGYKKLKMLFIPFMGAMVQGEKDSYSQRESALMLLAGPVPGIITGFLILYFRSESEMSWLIQLGVLFIFLNVLNLIPIDPLDGGQLFRTLFFGNHELIQLIFTVISSLSLILIGFWMDSWLIMGFGFLMGFKVKTAYKLYNIRKDLSAENIEYVSTYEKLTDKAFSKIKKVLIEYTPILKDIEEETDDDRYNQLLANQVDNILVRPLKKDVNLLAKILFLIIWFGSFYLVYLILTTIDFNTIINAFQSW